MGLFRANETHRWNRIPTGKRQTSWLRTRATEELNQGLPETNPAGDQSGNWKLGISRIQAQLPNHSVMIWSGITVWITQKGTWSNHNDDGNRNPTNLYIRQWKTVFVHALHEHISFFDILKTFSLFLRREMTLFAVVWTTWAYDDKCSILSSYAPSAASNLIPG